MQKRQISRSNLKRIVVLKNEQLRWLNIVRIVTLFKFYFQQFRFVAIDMFTIVADALIRDISGKY